MMERSTPKKEEHRQNNNAESKAVHIAFLVWGALFYAFESAPLSGAQDILAGTQLQTSTVFVCWISASLLANALGPNVVIKIPHILSTSLTVIFMFSGVLMIAIGNHVNIKLIGVFLNGIGTGFSNPVIISLSTFFNSKHIRQAFSTGTALGFLIGMLYYTAMTTWVCLSPTSTLFIMAPSCFLAFACFYVIKKNLDVKISRNTIYTKLPNSEASTGEDKVDRNRVTIKTKLSAIMTLCIYTAVPLFLGFFSQYLMMQSIISTLAYQNSPFRPRDHFQYYIIILWVGELIARSHRVILAAINPEYLYTVTAKNLWILAIIEVLHMLFLFCEAWYRFLPGAGIVLFLCFTAGIFLGMLYANSFELLYFHLNDKEKEFGMAYFCVPITIAILAAGLLGFSVEIQLKQHCITLVTNSFCSTRSSSFKDVTLKCGT